MKLNQHEYVIIIFRIFLLVTIFILICVITRYLLKKLNYFKSRNKSALLASIGVGLLFYFIYFISIYYYMSETPQIEFNETVWKTDYKERPKMVNDLVNSKYVIGKNLKQIEDIFGKPYQTDTIQNTFTYELVEYSGLGVKVTYLKLNINDSIVKSFETKVVYD